MKKRYPLHCWNCERKYSFLCEVSDELKAFAVCPYCDAEAVVDFNPYRKPTIEVFKGVLPAVLESLDLPDILPTQKPT